MIKLLDCIDGDIQINNECNSWLATLLQLLEEQFGSESVIRLGAYNYGASSHLTIDLLSNESRDKYLAITVSFSKNEIFLPNPSLEQMDLCLPGIVDAFWLIKSIAHVTKARIDF